MGVPGFLFFLIVLTRSNFDHYTRECGFWNFEENKTKHVVRPPFGSTVMSPMGENGLAPLEGRSESPSPVKADWNCL